MRWFWFRSVVCLTVSACALFPPLNDLTSGDASTQDASDAANVTDSSADANDAGADAATCGYPGPTQGLIAYYPFEEGQGNTIHDCSPNHFDGAFVQQATSGNWAVGKKGGGISVQSTNGCVDLGVHAAFKPTVLSVSVWVNVGSFPSIGTVGYIVGQSFNADIDGWRFGSRMTDAGTFLGWEHTVTVTHYLLDVPAPPTGTWHHVAVTFISGTLQIFIDGTPSSSATGFAATAYDSASLRIGCRGDGASSFDGFIDEVRFYNRLLTSVEIASLAQ